MKNQLVQPDHPPASARDAAHGTKGVLLVGFAAAWGLSCIRSPYPNELILQHVPTVLAVLALVVADRRWPFSMASFASLVAFLGLHLLGARYLYSNVPYDDWLQAAAGVDASTQFGWRRNHYDRLVHIAYGLLLVGPLREGLVRGAGLRGGWSHALAVACVLATSAGYELLEWFVAVALSPEAADAYNGQQGDIWDAQKDMTLAVGGAIVGTVYSLVHRKRTSGAAATTAIE